ncbi:MAG: response regulator transcription factor [Coriobacteriales bacterium]|jgi:DNA-binding response OmpR family regulator|nr:response regulator transcription factor [Coriobacteriales bacterium]
MNILLVEDQQRLAHALAAILEDEGYHVDAVGDGRSGLEYALSAQKTGTPYDAVVLDVMLPLMDGFEVARELRRAGGNSPVIMLTARDTLHDKITGLDAGADDYLTKPFQPAELLARLRAITRRSGTVHVEGITFGNTTLDLQSADLRVGGGAGAAGAGGGAGDTSTSAAGADGSGRDTQTSVHLSQREFELCQLLMTHPGQTFTKATILARVWGLDTGADENSVEAYISFLRKKLAYLGSNLSIITARGMGYRLEVADDSDAR